MKKCINCKYCEQIDGEFYVCTLHNKIILREEIGCEDFNEESKNNQEE